MDVATILRTARQRAGLTQARLAARAGTSAPTLSDYEQGKRRPRADVLLRLLDAAGLEVVLVPTSIGATRYVDRYCDELAQHVRRDPQVLERAVRELDRMPQNANVQAWRALLSAGPEAVVAVLTSRDPEARGLKADNPFARLGLVDEGTRLELLGHAPG